MRISRILLSRLANATLSLIQTTTHWRHWPRRWTIWRNTSLWLVQDSRYHHTTALHCYQISPSFWFSFRFVMALTHMYELIHSRIRRKPPTNRSASPHSTTISASVLLFVVSLTLRLASSVLFSLCCCVALLYPICFDSLSWRAIGSIDLQRPGESHCESGDLAVWHNMQCEKNGFHPPAIQQAALDSELVVRTQRRMCHAGSGWSRQIHSSVAGWLFFSSFTFYFVSSDSANPREEVDFKEQRRNEGLPTKEDIFPVCSRPKQPLVSAIPKNLRHQSVFRSTSCQDCHSVMTDVVASVKNHYCEINACWWMKESSYNSDD